MLGEGRRRATRGTDVVIGVVETHGRAATAEQTRDLELVPRRTMTHRGATFEEMDLDAVLARKPEVVLVDELAHSNVPGSRHEKRWQDVMELLDAGIDVISTVNVQHLESINDVVERITGVVQRETVPDHVVRAADQVELVDMTPEALRRRLAHGNVYAPEKIDAALANYFRPGNLTALRELALLWVADQVDSSLEEYRERHGITDPWETRERVVVAITGAPGTEQLIRRAARIAQRSHGELLGVHVRGDDGLLAGVEAMDRHRELLEQVGGRLLDVAGTDVAASLVATARNENATQIILGASRQSRWRELFRGSVINRVIRLSGAVDVHVISQEAVASDPAPRSPRRRRPPSLPPRRRLLGWLLAAAGLPALTAVLTEARADVDLPSVLLLYLALAVGVAATGGAAPAAAAAVGGFLCANWYFTPPVHTWTIAQASHLLALVVFLTVSGTVSAFVSLAARRAADAVRASSEAETLAAIAGSLSAADPLPELVAQLQTVFGIDGVALLSLGADGWQVEAHAGDRSPHTPEEASVTEPVGDGLLLALSGGPLGPGDRRVLRAFAASLSAAQERRRLGAQAATAAALAQANELRSSLLQAVSHDLRTPLASIKASVSSLRQEDVAWSDDDRAAFLTTVEEETDRLTALVVNLLDMSRISAGVVRPDLRPVGVDEVVPAALVSLGDVAGAIGVDVPEALPAVNADPTLLERALANLVQNALAHGNGAPVSVHAGAIGDRVEIRITDRGPGIPRNRRDDVFRPFQRLGDTGGGVGLGLAVADGFVRAMGGTLSVEETPGGGTTMLIELTAAM
jgi:two-component system sensor histidine kinase KdpD